jgi:hypothetical protein
MGLGNSAWWRAAQTLDQQAGQLKMTPFVMRAPVELCSHH